MLVLRFSFHLDHNLSLIMSKYHGPHQIATKGHIIRTWLAWNNRSKFVTFHHSILHIEKCPTIFVLNFYYTFQVVIYLDIIYIFNTNVMLQAVIKTIRRWIRIQYQIFIRCIVASIVLCNSKILIQFAKINHKSKNHWKDYTCQYEQRWDAIHK